MIRNSKGIVAVTAIALVALLSVCILNYWLSVRAVDDLLRREMARGANATALDISSAAVAGHEVAIGELRRGLLINAAVSLAVVILSAVALNWALRRRSRSLERVTEGAMAIADGHLDERLTTSRDDMRLFATSINTLSARLREQLEREAESRQFESFMRVAAMLAHDLKNAINGLSLLVANMDGFHERKEFRDEAMAALKEETAKLQRLVNRLSDPVSSMSGEHGRPQPTDLVPMIERVVKTTVSSPHQIDLRLPEKLVAIVDADRIEKVIENLVLNACEAIGRQPGTVTLNGGGFGDGNIFVSVADTGPGMSAEFRQKRLFHAFSTTKRRGLGLGLYTCREVIKAHGGHIDVDSQPGSGATFRVVLPCAPIRPATATVSHVEDVQKNPTRRRDEAP